MSQRETIEPTSPRLFPKFPWQRWGMAASALLLTGVGVVLSQRALEPGIYLAMVRAGILCGVIWLAWPQLFDAQRPIRIPAYLWAAIIGLLLIAAIRPRWLPIVLVLAVLLVVLHWLGRTRWRRWFSS